LAVVAGSALLLTVGCSKGGGGLSSLFGGGDSSETAEILSALVDPTEGLTGGSGDAAGGAGDILGGAGDILGGPGGSPAAQAASTAGHAPEPGSLALFGGGLAGIALWRRRRSPRRTASK